MEDILGRLQQATSEAEKTWILTEDLLRTLPPSLAEAAIAASVPHWFDQAALTALLKVETEEAESLYEELRNLSLTEPFGSLGHTLHDLTRAGVLTHLAAHQRELLQTYSRRAFDHFSNLRGPQNAVEATYHLLISVREAGLERFKKQMNEFRHGIDLTAADNLVRNARELVELSLLGESDAAEVERENELMGWRGVELGKKDRTPDETQPEPSPLPEVISIPQYRYLFQKVDEAHHSIVALLKRTWLTILGKVSLFSKFALARRGDTHRLMGNYPAALADFDRAIALEDKYAWAIAHRGETYRRVGNYPEALADFDRAIALDDKYAWAIASRGETCRRMGNYPAALADFDRAIALEPDDDWAYYQRGLLYLATGGDDRARDHFSEAIRLASRSYSEDPEDWRNTFNLALYHLADGEPESAEQLYREALAASVPVPNLLEARADLDDLLGVLPGLHPVPAISSLLQEHLV